MISPSSAVRKPPVSAAWRRHAIRAHHGAGHAARADKLPKWCWPARPPAVSVPLIHMVETGALKDIGRQRRIRPVERPRPAARAGAGRQGRFRGDADQRGGQPVATAASRSNCSTSRPGACCGWSRATRPEDAGRFPRQGNRHALPRRHAGHRLRPARRKSRAWTQRISPCATSPRRSTPCSCWLPAASITPCSPSRRCRWRCARPGPSRSA